MNDPHPYRYPIAFRPQLDRLERFPPGSLTEEPGQPLLASSSKRNRPV